MTLARYGYLLAFGLFFLTVASWQSGPAAQVFGVATVAVLLYQTWFVLGHTDVAIEAGVLIPYSNGIDTLDSWLGAALLALVSVGFAVMLGVGLYVS